MLFSRSPEGAGCGPGEAAPRLPGKGCVPGTAGRQRSALGTRGRPSPAQPSHRACGPRVSRDREEPPAPPGRELGGAPPPCREPRSPRTCSSLAGGGLRPPRAAPAAPFRSRGSRQKPPLGPASEAQRRFPQDTKVFSRSPRSLPGCRRGSSGPGTWRGGARSSPGAGGHRGSPRAGALGSFCEQREASPPRVPENRQLGSSALRALNNKLGSLGSYAGPTLWGFELVRVSQSIAVLGCVGITRGPHRTI